MVEENPTVLYQDNQPAIQVASGNRNLASKTKHMDIRVWKLKERIDDRLIVLEFCSTHDMLADLGTKPLGIKQFQYLRDFANGYSLCRAMHPDMDLRPIPEANKPQDATPTTGKRKATTRTTVPTQAGDVAARKTVRFAATTDAGSSGAEQ